MKTKEGFKLRTLGREFVLSAEGSMQVDFHKVISMNASAAFVWNAVKGLEFDTVTIADLLVSEYEIDRKTAEKDAAALLKKWIEIGIVAE